MKDTTIQFTLEKVPIDEDAQFTFITSEEPWKSTGLLRVEGKFVNPVQVYTFVNKTVNMLKQLVVKYWWYAKS